MAYSCSHQLYIPTTTHYLHPHHNSLSIWPPKDNTTTTSCATSYSPSFLPTTVNATRSKPSAVKAQCGQSPVQMQSRPPRAFSTSHRISPPSALPRPNVFANHQAPIEPILGLYVVYLTVSPCSLIHSCFFPFTHGWWHGTPLPHLSVITSPVESQVYLVEVHPCGTRVSECPSPQHSCSPSFCNHGSHVLSPCSFCLSSSAWQFPCLPTPSETSNNLQQCIVIISHIELIIFHSKHIFYLFNIIFYTIYYLLLDLFFSVEHKYNSNKWKY